MKKLEGKVAIVSGSGRGIGREIALKLASEGASVVVNDLDAAPANETVEVIRATGGKGIACVGSVTDADFGARFVGAAVDGFGGLDIIVNNAGYTWDNVIQKMTDEQWDAILQVHLTAPFRILRAASEFIRGAAKKEAEAGQEVFRKVVNISSTSGVMGNAGQANYAAAKAGIIGFTKTAAKELARFGVTVNAISPNAETRMVASVPAEKKSELAAAIPMGRFAHPSEMCAAVSFLASAEAGYITGIVMPVDGGISM
jgi:3-oxoacyl-[acyl-carrier protein] reductase